MFSDLISVANQFYRAILVTNAVTKRTHTMLTFFSTIRAALRKPRHRA